MPKTYGSNQRDVKPAQLPDATLRDIGRLVRACAEIEDIVDLFIASLAELNETRAFIMLGRTAISRRLEIALELAKVREDNALAVHKTAFDAVFNDILECRNAVAHGKLLGKTEDGFAFLTGNSGPVRDDSKIRIVASYTAATIKEYARVAEARIPQLEAYLKVEGPRSERLRRPLLPHSKAQPQANAGRQRQPRSSQA